MSRSTRKQRQGTARRVADAALDVTVGGTALAADKAIETVEGIVERAGRAVRQGRREARDAAGEAVRTARSAVESRDGRAYEDRTRDELYALAAERDIEGRSSMTKAELIAALRAER